MSDADGCPPIDAQAPDRATSEISRIREQRASHLTRIGAREVAYQLEQVIGHLDVSVLIRQSGNSESADFMIDQARGTLIRILGIDQEGG